MTTFEGTFARDPSLFRFAIVISRFNDLVVKIV
jgi:6,7-dimethyl-8-ribityllumazine synthase